MFQLENKPLALDVPFTHNDVQYPSNWLRLATPEERAAVGITEVADAPVYDDRFYWGVNSPKLLEDRLEVKEDGSPLMVQAYSKSAEGMVDTDEQVVTRGLKSHWSAQIKDTTNKLLAATDWMVIRKAERDVAIPADTVAYRAAVLNECDRLLAAIAGAADVEALATVVGAQNWPEVK
jgi:hypothetical protein